ncbi:MAG: ATP-binding cassette domain-containing protein [Thermodesulfobacteriota bacterium]|nr:ATP-binding cassette domain-containing protein [Thermodesulfobacteriota bacterium]
MTDVPILNIKNIHKRFGDLEVLHGISLTASSGDVISLIGSSGSGKSTFLRCINLLETPDQGDIELDGKAIQFATDRTGKRVASDAAQVQNLRSRIAMVFQQFNLWSHMTVLQNVTEAPMRVKGLSRVEANEAGMAFLDKVGIADKADLYPAFMSGGQQQRAAIARALAMEPEAILFDEPTSALDPELVGEVLSVMRQLAEEGTTMIVVTHEMSFARDVCNKALFLHSGLIEEQGDPAKMFSSPESKRLQQFLSSAMD